MLKKIGQFAFRNGSAFLARFRNGVGTRGALLLSLLLHVIAAAAVASFYAGTGIVAKVNPSEDIVFELVTEPISAALSPVQADAKQGAGPATDTQAFRENRQNPRAVLSSSFASLSNLKSSFTFVKHSTSSDSTDSLVPVSGPGPNTDGLTQGFEDDFGSGNGSGVQISIGGGGICVPGPGR